MAGTKIKLYSVTVWLTAILVLVYQALFFFTADESESSGRIDRIPLIILVLIFVYYFIKTYRQSIHNNPIRLFIWALVGYALFYTSNYDKVISTLPSILYSLCSFFFFYYYSKKEAITRKLLWFLFLGFVIISFFYFREMTLQKVEIHGENYFTKSNNAGYIFVVLLPLTVAAIRNSTTRLLVSTLFLGLVFFSFKRGAIITFSAAYLVLLVSYFRSTTTMIGRVYLFVISLSLILGVAYFALENAEEIFFRFSLEGGSGRDIIISSILSTWVNGSFFQLLFGFGFFATTDVTGKYLAVGQMAHSDYLEVLFDMGLFGLTIYLLILRNLLIRLKDVKKFTPHLYEAYLVLVVIWGVKSMFSGIFMYKESILVLAVLGYVWGQVDNKMKAQKKLKRYHAVY